MPRKRTIPTICVMCNQAFVAFNAQHQCCSPECSNLYQHQRASQAIATLTCRTCNQPFDVPRTRAESAMYCSSKCYGIAKGGPRIHVTCKHCGTGFDVKPSRLTKAKGGASYCSRACATEDSKNAAKVRRDTTLTNYWRDFVLERDGRQCQQCGVTERLNAHHIKPWATYPAGRFDPANGITLCIDCHRNVHRKAA